MDAWFILSRKHSLIKKKKSTNVTFTHHLAGNCSTCATAHPSRHTGYVMSPINVLI